MEPKSVLTSETQVYAEKGLTRISICPLLYEYEYVVEEDNEEQFKSGLDRYLRGMWAREFV